MFGQTDLTVDSNNQVITVLIQYRLGAFGTSFLERISYLC